MTDSTPKRIFISYSRKDGAGTAATLRKGIEAQNLAVWQDIAAMEAAGIGRRRSRRC